MREIVIQTTEPVSTIEANEVLVKILDSTYSKADLKQVSDNTTHIKSDERTQLLSLLEDFEDLFDVTLGDWDTEPVDLELNPYYKPFNFKYYPVPRINKDNFRKYLICLVKIGVLTPLQQSQYGNTVFIIPKRKKGLCVL